MVGKIPWRRKWQPTPVFLPGEFHRQRSLVGYSPWGHSWTQLSDYSFQYKMFSVLKKQFGRGPMGQKTHQRPLWESVFSPSFHHLPPAQQPEPPDPPSIWDNLQFLILQAVLPFSTRTPTYPSSHSSSEIVLTITSFRASHAFY